MKHVILASTCIDPQKPAPCITAIGYNGAQLWQNGMIFLKMIWRIMQDDYMFLEIECAEGFVGAELLASTLEKAWLGLHIQVRFT